MSSKRIRWFRSLQANAQVDVCFTEEHRSIKWYFMHKCAKAMVINRKDAEAIQIRYAKILDAYEDPNGESTVCWIKLQHMDDDSMSIHPFRTFSIAYERLVDLPRDMSYGPVVFAEDGYFVFNTVGDWEYPKQLWCCDMRRNKLTVLGQMTACLPNNATDEHLINIGLGRRQNEVLVMGQKFFFTFDVLKSEWKVIEYGGCSVYAGENNTSYHCPIYVDGKLHLVAHQMHGVWDEKKEQFIGLQHAQKHLFAPYWLIFVESLNVLFALSEESKNIVYCDLDQEVDGDNWYQWQLYPIALPSSAPNGCFLAFGCLIFIFCADSQEIFCVDVFHQRLFKSSKKHPDIDMNCVCFDEKTKFIHLCDEYHVRIKLEDVMPQDAMKFYNLLMYGYLRSNQLLQLVSNDILNLLCLFFLPDF